MINCTTKRCLWAWLITSLLALGYLSCSPLVEAADLVERGVVGGYIHDSNPRAGSPFNKDPEIWTDQVGMGYYWKWKNQEVHLWLTRRVDHVPTQGSVSSSGAVLMYMWKVPL